MKAYNPTIAVMKGVAIVAVVLGHCASFQYTDAFVNQWHLAVFFFVGGWLFKAVPTAAGFRYDLWKRTRRLLVPYLCACIVFLALHNFLHRIGLYDSALSLKEIVKATLRLSLLATNEPLLGAMWFCPALWMISVWALVLLRIVAAWGKNVHVEYWMFLPFSMSVVMLYLLHAPSPYCIWQYGIMSFFFALGHIVVRHEERIKAFLFNRRCLTYAYIAVCLGAVALTTGHGPAARLQPSAINSESPLGIVLVGFLGILGVYLLATTITESYMGKALAFVGNYSFSIMLLHFCAFKMAAFLQCCFVGLPFERMSAFPTIEHSWRWTHVYWILGIGVPILANRAVVLVGRTAIKNVLLRLI